MYYLIFSDLKVNLNIIEISIFALLPRAVELLLLIWNIGDYQILLYTIIVHNVNGSSKSNRIVSLIIIDQKKRKEKKEGKEKKRKESVKIRKEMRSPFYFLFLAHVYSIEEKLTLNWLIFEENMFLS